MLIQSFEVQNKNFSHVILRVVSWVFVYEQAVIDVLPCSFGACKKRERCLLMSLPALLSMAVNCICTKHEQTKFFIGR
jgi:hypothetical protein